VQAQPWDPEFRDRCLAPPKAEEYEKVMAERGTISQELWLQRLEQVFLSQAPKGREIDWERDFDEEMALRIAGGSLAVGVIDKVVSVKELIDTIISEAERILGRKGTLGKLLT